MTVDNARFRFQLRKEEWDDYPRGNEWFTFDIDEIDRDMPTDKVIELEAELGFSFDQVVNGLAYGGARAKLMAFYIARRLAGVDEKWEFFNPRVRAASVFPLDGEPKADDAGPPVPAASDAEPLTS